MSDMSDSVAWFVDGAYVFETWRDVAGGAHLDYVKLRNRLEHLYCKTGQTIDEAYYFNADPDPPTAARNNFHTFLSHRPPTGPGLRVKLYWLNRKSLSWPRHMGGEPVLHPTTGAPFELTQQKGVDVGLAFHLVMSFYRRRWSTLILGAGDGDFHEVVQHLVEHEGVKVIGLGVDTNMSTELRPYLSDLFSLKAEFPNLIK
ncbi:MAG TPA: NYN domain-containing protein [Nannocystaceae bacterium]|nr:NYN domain-containing protein [Nannocystaceae bacterium]